MREVAPQGKGSCCLSEGACAQVTWEHMPGTSSYRVMSKISLFFSLPKRIHPVRPWGSIAESSRCNPSLQSATGAMPTRWCSTFTKLREIIHRQCYELREFSEEDTLSGGVFHHL